MSDMRPTHDDPLLGPLDAAFLEIEDVVPSAHMHLGAVLLLAPPGDGAEALTVSVLRARVAERLDRHPASRCRLAARRADGLRRPRWIDDPQFRVERHVRAAALPSPGGRRELDDWAGDFFSHALDRAHPLWEMVLVEGLQDGGLAIAVKLHHCLADGMGAVGMTDLIADASIPTVPVAPGPRRARPVPAQLLAGAAEAALHPARAARAMLDAAAALRTAVGAVGGTTINGPVGTRRAFGTVSVSLRELREIERAFGCTVNDAFLAITADGLHRLLASRCAPAPAGVLRAMVPVDVRAGGVAGRGNAITALFVPLPVDDRDVADRLRTIAGRTTAKKRGHEGPGARALVELSGAAPPVLQRVAVRVAATPRLFHLTVTNVRGPRRRIRVLGRTITQIQPFVPLGPEHHVGVALVTYGGTATVGVAADADHVPDLPVLLDGVSQAHVQLLREARRTVRADRRSSSRAPATTASATSCARAAPGASSRSAPTR